MAHEAIQRGARLSSLKERRRHYRQETVDAILAAARAVMQELGVAALNLNGMLWKWRTAAPWPALRIATGPLEDRARAAEGAIEGEGLGRSAED